MVQELEENFLIASRENQVDTEHITVHVYTHTGDTCN